MSFWKRLEFALLPHTLDQSHSERAEAVDQLWDEFIFEYLKEYKFGHLKADGTFEPQTILSKHQLKSRLKQFWFKPRALKGHKIIHNIDDTYDYAPTGGFTWSHIKPATLEKLAELFDDMFLEVERLIHQDGVYFYHKSRDCDQCESDGMHRFDSWYEAAQWITSFYEGLEGPGHVMQVTLNAYLTFEPTTRDYRAEQYNY